VEVFVMRYMSVVLAIACLFLLLGLNASIEKIHKLESQLAEKEDEIAIQQDELNQTELKLLQTQEELNSTRAELSQLHENYYILKKNPSYEELDSLLKSTYITMSSDKKPICSHISYMYWRYLTEHGVFASPAALYLKYRYGYAGHMVLTFNTSDRGIVYYDPVGDIFVNISLNEDYFGQNGIKYPFAPAYVVDYVHYWDYSPKHDWR
jgi:hypothetical protein